MQTSMGTFVQTSMQTFMQTSIQTFMQTSMQTFMQTFTLVQTFMWTFVQSFMWVSMWSRPFNEIRWVVVTMLGIAKGHGQTLKLVVYSTPLKVCIKVSMKVACIKVRMKAHIIICIKVHMEVKSSHESYIMYWNLHLCPLKFGNSHQGLQLISHKLPKRSVKSLCLCVTLMFAGHIALKFTQHFTLNT